MFDLGAALREWRRTARRHSMTGSELDELEDHLHSAYVVHRGRGETPPEAFALALRSLGAVEEVSAEYHKVRSSTWRRLLKVGWVAFATAFFLPVIHGGITLLEPNLGEGLLPGFQAIRVAIEGAGWSALSALTNVLLLRTMWRSDEIGRPQSLLLCVALAASALLNGVWLTDGGITDLRIGYYLWLGSFGLASSAFLMRARELGHRLRSEVVS